MIVRDAKTLADDFRTALGTEQVTLHYQPIFELAGGQLVGFEALMRWNHPAHGNIPPSTFIPIAEQSGLIVEASRWALRESCRALDRMGRRAGFKDELFMSVNFSAKDFAEENFLDQLYTIISETDTDPALVHLEITERMLLDDPPNAKETLALCRRAGLSVAVDDFGLGAQVSAAYLSEYPLDELKIDQAFIRALPENEMAYDFVKSAIDLTRGLGIRTIAEGVETEAERALLLYLGCTQAQGYLFARPQPEGEAVTNIQDWRRGIY